ncbi:MAG: MBOAT family protein, partial [Proteobacteria bacterium]|nr:MBOAT family protein [Pseudomonadota bacterium]
EVMPQYLKDTAFRPALSNIRIGLMIFVIGLYKKVVIADGITVFANAVFGADVVEPTLLDAWAGTLAYTFQIYFDFSGYSDMAIGLARIFGIKLPLNFHSPYKATNIIDFWRRWHMTLSRFLRDYLYIPLGGSRAGELRRFANMVIVMLLGGLWHGAGWTFVLWGGAHGVLLGATHWAQHAAMLEKIRPPRSLAVATTFLCVVFTWVMFRAGSVSEFVSMTQSMLGLNQPLDELATQVPALATLAILTWAALVMTWIVPNTGELTARWGTSGLGLKERVLLPWACGIGVSACVIGIFLGSYSEFIYFQF